MKRYRGEECGMRLSVAKNAASYLFMFSFPVLFAAGCSGGKTTDKNTGIAGEDDIGRVVSLPYPARRIVLMTGSPADVLFELGVGNAIVGVTDNFTESYPATCRKYPLLRALPNAGRFSSPNVEAILALKPDLVLVSGSGDNPERNALALKKVGLTYAIMKTFEGIEPAFAQIERLAVFCGRVERGKEIVAKLRGQLAARKSLVNSCAACTPAVYYWWGSGDGTYGDASALDALVSLAGGRNIARKGGKGYYGLSSEFVVAENPEVIILTYWRERDRDARIREIASRPEFEGIRAIRTGRIHAFDGHMIHSAMLFPEVIDSFITWFHPEAHGEDPIDTGYGRQSGERPVTDDRGRIVTVSVSPEKIVAVATGDVEILYAIGAQNRLAGVPDNVKFPREAKSLNKIGGMYGRFSPERIVGAKPDLVLMTMSGWDHYAKHLERLAAYDLAVLGLDYPSTFDGLLMHIRRLGCLCGRGGRAESLVREIDTRKNAVTARTAPLDGNQRPRVYMEWISNSGRGTTCGRNDRDHRLITMAGGTNVFGDVEQSSITPSDEEVIARDPQIIVITADTARFAPEMITAEVAARKGWDRTAAVRDRKIAVMEATLTWANPRMVEGLETLARIIHPELFQ